MMKDFYHRYESITKLEYESANKKNVPIYILIEKSVYSEYNTFKNNRENKSIKYAHVDSINMFYLIEKILNQPRNNPIYTFEKHQEIERWLKEQWSGLFKEMLNRRSESSQLASLSKQVGELAEINTTLKRYLEEVVSKVSEEDAAKIIKDEDKRLKDSKKNKEFESDPVVTELTGFAHLKLAQIKKIYEDAGSLDHFAKLLEDSVSESDKKIWNQKDLVAGWKTALGIIENVNRPRLILGLSELKFENQETPKRKR